MSNFKETLASMQENRFSKMSLETACFDQNKPVAFFTKDNLSIALNIHEAGDDYSIAARYVQSLGLGKEFGEFTGIFARLPMKIEGAKDTPPVLELGNAKLYGRNAGGRSIWTPTIVRHEKQVSKDAKPKVTKAGDKPKAKRPQKKAPANA